MGRKWQHLSKDSEGKHTKPYDQWHQMRQRCKLGGLWQTKYICYAGCHHQDSWESYDQFYSWAEQQVGFLAVDSEGKGYQLDKDFLLKGNLRYSEDLCVFIPQSLNKFLTLSSKARGAYPVGVCRHAKNGNFMGYIGSGYNKTHLGVFATPELAFQAYKVAKESKAKNLAEKYKGLVDDRVITALLNFTVNIDD